MVNVGAGYSLNSSSNFSPSSRKGQLYQRWRQLETNRQTWLAYYRDLSDYIFPRRGEFLFQGAYARGNSRHDKIIDNKAIMALRTFEAGMMSGATSPTLPWFRIRTKDHELMKHDDVKIWCDEASDSCRRILHSSNFYTVVANMYSELGAFGTAAMYRQKLVGEKTMHFTEYTAGEYAIAQNDRDEIDTIARCYTMTTTQIVEKFIQSSYDRNMFDWDKCSLDVRQAWENGNYEYEWTVIHIIQPRRHRIHSNPSNLNMPFESVYFELGGNQDTLLHESGYMNFPAYVPRWRTHGRDIYGSSPAMDCLGDSKQLQSEQLQKSQGLAKIVNPPVKADSSLRSRATSTAAGSITYVEERQGATGISPIYETRTSIREISEDINEVRQRISEAMYEPLFVQFALSSTDGDKMTAAEVGRRYAEQLKMLTPMYHSLNKNLLTPLVKDVFEFAGEQGSLPDMPSILQDMERPLDVEYTSLMARAQDTTVANGIERVVSFVGNLAGVAPDVLDNVDLDKTARSYIDIVGVEAETLRPKEDMANIREQRAKQEEQQATLDAVEQGAGAAKLLSETDTGGTNALTSLTGR